MMSLSTGNKKSSKISYKKNPITMDLQTEDPPYLIRKKLFEINLCNKLKISVVSVS